MSRQESRGLEQGSEDWLAWRTKGVGSSDAPAIMNVSPYLTAYELWQEKLGLRPPPKLNFVMERGQRLEPAARAHYELLNDRDMPAMTATHKHYPFIRASLDGANEELQRILEIKCAGVVTFEDALHRQMVPEHHMMQLQHQLLVTGFKQADYFVYYKGQGALVEVLPDEALMERLLKEIIVFWDCVERKLPPPLCEKDRKRIKREEKKKHV